MITLKAATCGSTFAHAHRGRGTCCSSTQNPPVRPAGARFVRLGLHLIALWLSCSAACEVSIVTSCGWCGAFIVGARTTRSMTDVQDAHLGDFWTEEACEPVIRVVERSAERPGE